MKKCGSEGDREIACEKKKRERKHCESSNQETWICNQYLVRGW